MVGVGWRPECPSAALGGRGGGEEGEDGAHRMLPNCGYLVCGEVYLVFASVYLVSWSVCLEVDEEEAAPGRGREMAEGGRGGRGRVPRANCPTSHSGRPAPQLASSTRKPVKNISPRENIKLSEYLDLKLIQLLKEILLHRVGFPKRVKFHCQGEKH